MVIPLTLHTRNESPNISNLCVESVHNAIVLALLTKAKAIFKGFSQLIFNESV